ncbi:hypothetical protein A2U01_0085540, partial [Trifolium medium]|nr:hypothetical protein [Trifolium medium]
QSTMLCVRSPGEDHDVARRGVSMMSPVLARTRQYAFCYRLVFASPRQSSPGEQYWD